MPLLPVEYAPWFFVFYLGNSIRVNCVNHFAGQREWVGMLIRGFGNSIGLILLIEIQYLCLVKTGKVYWNEEWIYVNLLLGVIPMMFVFTYSPVFLPADRKSRFGPMITCLVFNRMMLTNDVCYLPLD